MYYDVGLDQYLLLLDGGKGARQKGVDGRNAETMWSTPTPTPPTAPNPSI